MELGIGGGERERRGWFEQMFCGARTVKTVPYSAFYNVRQYLWCTHTRRGAQCAPAALKGNCSFLGRAYLSNILIQHILQSLLGQETDAAGGFLAVFQYDQAGDAGNAVFGGKLAVFVHINAVKCGFAANFIGKLMQDRERSLLLILVTIKRFPPLIMTVKQRVPLLFAGHGYGVSTP